MITASAFQYEAGSFSSSEDLDQLLILIDSYTGVVMAYDVQQMIQAVTRRWSSKITHIIQD